VLLLFYGQRRYTGMMSKAEVLIVTVRLAVYHLRHPLCHPNIVFQGAKLSLCYRIVGVRQGLGVEARKRILTI
tara:strand:+ start:193 stop:411 length:219 start_codon:yes stop_codon:yes gene_type:complete